MRRAIRSRCLMWSPPVNQFPMGDTNATTTARSNSYHARDFGDIGLRSVEDFDAANSSCALQAGEAGVDCSSWDLARRRPLHSRYQSAPFLLPNSQTGCQSSPSQMRAVGRPWLCASFRGAIFWAGQNLSFSSSRATGRARGHVIFV
jgi:hypothetical protein